MIFKDMIDYADCIRMQIKMKFILCFSALYNYETLRQKYLPRKYYIFPNVNKFNILMSSHSETVIHNVATYLYYAFKLRQEFREST